MKPVGGAKFYEVRIASCRILAMTTGLSPDECKKSNFELLYLHVIFRSFLCINCDDSMLNVQNTWRRNIIKQGVRP